jgi:hypothetical protein
MHHSTTAATRDRCHRVRGDDLLVRCCGVCACLCGVVVVVVVCVCVFLCVRACLYDIVCACVSGWLYHAGLHTRVHRFAWAQAKSIWASIGNEEFNIACGDLGIRMLYVQRRGVPPRSPGGSR